MSSLSAITVGNFDGVHEGHAALVRAARDRVGVDGRVIVLSFDPHPVSVLRPDLTPTRLSRFDQRTKWLEEHGVDEVHRLEPTKELLSRSPRDFVAWVTERFEPSVFVEGPDFRFGKDRAGDVRTLGELESEFGYRTLVIDPVESSLTDGHIVSVRSSLLRWLIARGRVRDAERLMGHPYELIGDVVPGDRRGRSIGVPTANLDHDQLLLPADGVYSGIAHRPDGAAYPAAISVGRKPTFDASPRTCEAHLIGYDGPIGEYGWELQLAFSDWLRDQVAFNSVEALVDQLRRDIARTHVLSPAPST